MTSEPTPIDERRALRLAAYHDGELGPMARWRVRRWLARDPLARQELDSLVALGDLLRQEEAEARTPDLWPGIEQRLPRRSEAGRPALVAPWRSVWVPAGALAVATALVLAVGLDWGDAPDPRSVRWLDTGDRSAAVLQDDGEATIIWILDAADQVSGRMDRAVS